MVPALYPFFYLAVSLILVAIAAWVVNVYVPVQSGVRSIINLVLALVVVGIFLWLINTYVPMANSIKDILNIVVVVATCVYVLRVFGLWTEVVRLWDSAVNHLRASRGPGHPV
jgi:hypothetical protein